MKKKLAWLFLNILVATLMNRRKVRIYFFREETLVGSKANELDIIEMFSQPTPSTNGSTPIGNVQGRELNQ